MFARKTKRLALAKPIEIKASAFTDALRERYRELAHRPNNLIGSMSNLHQLAKDERDKLFREMSAGRPVRWVYDGWTAK